MLSPLNFVETNTMEKQRKERDLEILQYPHPMLEVKCEPVDFIGRDTVLLAQDMVSAMIKKNGLGLSANQVGAPIRMFVMKVLTGEDSIPQILTVINPAILEEKEEIQSMEGCLSFSYIEKLVPVKRHNNIVMSYCDLHGEYKAVELTGINAICAQHEIDHLNGITFVDKTKESIKKWLIRKAEKHLTKKWKHEEN